MSFPIKNGGSFHSYVSHYQRVSKSAENTFRNTAFSTQTHSLPWCTHPTHLIIPYHFQREFFRGILHKKNKDLGKRMTIPNIPMIWTVSLVKILDRHVWKRNSPAFLFTSIIFCFENLPRSRFLNVAIHNLPHFRVSSQHVAGSISEGVMCLTLMLCRCLSRFGPERGS